MKTDYSSVFGELRQFITEKMEKNNIPGLSIVLVEGDDPIWAEGFGYTDRTKEHKVTADTLFSLQSISKTYTAVGFLIAVGKGLVKLDDPLKRYYPEFTVRSRLNTDEAEKITFRYLLSHRSGLCHEAPVGGNYEDKECTFEEHIRSISDTWLMCPVGQGFRYSNLAFDLVGYALQLISGGTFIEYMREELLDPLGMQNSTYDDKFVMENCRYAKGHVGDYEAHTGIVPMVPAGGLYSSAREVARFISFHLSGGIAGGRRIIGEEILKEMYEPQFPVEGQIGGYGLGIGVYPRLGTMEFGHGGGGFGYLAVQKWLPEYNFGVAVLTNQSCQNNVHDILAGEAIKKMMEARNGAVPEHERIEFTNKPVVDLETSKLYLLEGIYRTRGGVVEVKVKDGDLWADFDTKAPLAPHSDTEFTTSEGFSVNFVMDETGRPAMLQLLQADGYNELPIDSAPSDEPGPGKEEWNDYTGIYSYVVDGNTIYAGCKIKNGFLCVVFNGWAKLKEFQAAVFFVSDGEVVTFAKNRMTYGNVPLKKEKDPLEKLRELVQTDPRNGRLREISIQSLGDVYTAMEDADLAIEVFEMNVKRHPESVSALSALAGAYFAKGDKTRSRKYYKKILEIDPANTDALEKMAGESYRNPEQT